MAGVFQITLKLFLLDHNGQLLVLRDKKSGLGDLPGGRIDQGEIYSPLTTILQREITEELGPLVVYELDSDILFTFPVMMWINGMEALGIAYRGRLLSGEIELSDEHDRHLWVDPITWNAEELFTGDMLFAIARFQKSLL